MAGKTTDGSWRPDQPFTSVDGLKITLRREANLTPAGVLKVPMRFQVPVLDSLPRPWRFNWSTYDTVSGGQRARPMGSQLLDLQVSTLLMDRLAAEASNVVVWGSAPFPQRVIDELRYIQRKAAPFRLVINQPAIWPEPVVNIVAVLTGVEPTIQSADIGTEALSISLLEYPETTVSSQRRATSSAKRHTLRAGDTLHKLAVRYLHAASGWKAIAKKNGITGVSANSAADLAKWAKRNHKTSLLMPEVEYEARVLPGGTARL